MEEIENINYTILLLAISQLKNKSFSIGSYQRGYKWGKKEILELLNDIHSYDNTNGIYCLQPLILKPKDGITEKIDFENKPYEIFKNNEVIDGQQRITTIFILLKYLISLGLINDSDLFFIDYQTRERSETFLKKDLKLIFDLNVDSISDQELIDLKYSDVVAVNKLWESFTKNHKEFDNVDVYHFFIVTCYIKKWINYELSTDVKKEKFTEVLLDSVKVIWYSLDDAKDNKKIIDVFLNNNKGKISLTSSELIKALFILNIKNSEMQSRSDLRINQFATDWDQIEKKLQDDNFWYFIQPNSNLYNNGTRIDYLFDLHIQKKEKDDDFFAYRFYESMFNQNKNISLEWEKIVQLYTKLVDWYNDSLIYHYLGFITVSGIKSLPEVIKESKGKTKDALKIYFKKLIKEEFEKKDKNEGLDFFIYELENLHYKTYYKETRKVLLLHNVLYYISNMAKHKFPFELFVKQNWSIEHIIPQNPKDITDVNIYKQWYKDIIEYNNETNLYSEIITQLNKYESIEEIKEDKGLKEKLDKIVEEFEDTTHKIDNLLLLDKNTNSALSNLPFKDKRIKILKFDKDGQNDKGIPVFIPIETLNAFNKTFGMKINIESWLREDGENYRDSIYERLNDFLPN